MKAFALEDGGGQPGQKMDHPRRSMYIHELGHLRLGWVLRDDTPCLPTDLWIQGKIIYIESQH